jgi:hypothetical protein
LGVEQGGAELLGRSQIHLTAHLQERVIAIHGEADVELCLQSQLIPV